ncbi:MAG: hypothetical protein K2J12_05090 [Muribaculaceae bacterium]|nr:hypothetical protein [Muribaculaceae bacterium]
MQPLKASSPIAVRPSPRLRVVSLRQPLNSDAPISVSAPPIESEVMLLPLK